MHVGFRFADTARRFRRKFERFSRSPRDKSPYTCAQYIAIDLRNLLEISDASRRVLSYKRRRFRIVAPMQIAAKLRRNYRWSVFASRRSPSRNQGRRPNGAADFSWQTRNSIVRSRKVKSSLSERREDGRTNSSFCLVVRWSCRRYYARTSRKCRLKKKKRKKEKKRKEERRLSRRLAVSRKVIPGSAEFLRTFSVPVSEDIGGGGYITGKEESRREGRRIEIARHRTTSRIVTA